jgi:TPP-dependent indolepyruvate ferredoxin oxidoreductase alpha subunit
VDVINPFQVKELEGLIKQRLVEDKLSVIIARYPCLLLKKRHEG